MRIKVESLRKLCFIVMILALCLFGVEYAQNVPEKPFSTEVLNHLLPHTIAIKGGKLEYYRFGQGSPIVLIPGYVTDVTSWNRQFLADLAEQHEVLVFNNPKVGGSQVRLAHYESVDLARATYQLIEALGLKKPAVLGISMGGMIAQQLAVLYPEKLSSLILMNTLIAGKQAVRPSVATEKILLAMPESKLGRYLVALKLFFSSSWRFKMGLALAVDRFQPQTYTEINPVTVMPLQRHLVLEWLQDEFSAAQIAHLALPVLILNGNADSVIPPINSRILARMIPGATLVSWREGGHAMIYQYPREIAEVINEFIAKSQQGFHPLDAAARPAA